MIAAPQAPLRRPQAPFTATDHPEGRAPTPYTRTVALDVVVLAAGRGRRLGQLGAETPRDARGIGQVVGRGRRGIEFGAPQPITRAMIAFAVCVASPPKFTSCAAPGLRLAMEEDSVLAELGTESSLHEAYNEALDHFATYPELEALVLLHEDVELLDPAFCDRLRAALADPAVAVVGAVGARRVAGLAWWEGTIAGRAHETRGVVDGGFEDPEVDAVDGLLLALSPWAVRTLRCDTSTFTGFHAYDVDLCFQARAAGRRVVVAPLSLFHHTKGGFGDAEAWATADAAFRAKWDLSASLAAAR